VKLDNFTLDKINFGVASGECLAVVGPNGSGKTTLLESIAGIHQIGAGRIEINGVDVTQLAPESRRVGYVPHDCLLFPHLRVDQNIGFGLRKRDVETKKQISEAMDWLGISHLAGRGCGGLSAGEKQKVALARVLVRQPDVLLLDEPFSAVDANSRVRLVEDLRSILSQARSTHDYASVYVSHDLAEAQLMAGKVAIMNSGNLEQVGVWEEIIQYPKSKFVAEFMGYNIIRGHVNSIENGFATVNIEGQILCGASTNLTPDQDVLVVVKPQSISLSLDMNVRKKSWCHCRCNIIEGSVSAIRSKGSIAQVSIDVGFPLSLDIGIDVVEEFGLSLGSQVFAQFKASEVIFLPATIGHDFRVSSKRC
jgi:ABC-type Fe3+/spermidine/putrescine transport system ATPase subunit